jgi:insertion element IS1 protein InsB
VAKKKAAELPNLSETLLSPDAFDPKSIILEADELWSFVLNKENKAWVWLVLCRKTRQVIAYVIGDRSAVTCQRLWESLPEAYSKGYCYTDFWDAYQKVIPKKQHSAVGKKTGETAHIERFNNTIRQRLGRFVRKTLSFSKSTLMHYICLSLFLHRYNLERASILD